MIKILFTLKKKRKLKYYKLVIVQIILIIKKILKFFWR